MTIASTATAAVDRQQTAQPQPIPGNPVPIQATALAIMHGNIGHAEDPNGSNSDKGGVISQGNVLAAGIDYIYWCCSSLYRAFTVAAKMLHIVNPLPRTASVSALFKYAKNHLTPMQIIPAQAVANGYVLPAGAIFGKGRDNQRLVPGIISQAHTGMYAKEINGKVHTCEGNVNNRFSERGLAIREFDAFIVIDEKQLKRLE